MKEKKTFNFQQINCTPFLPIHFSIINKMMQNERIKIEIRKGKKEKKLSKLFQLVLLVQGVKEVDEENEIRKY